MSVKNGAIIVTISILLSRMLSLFFIFPFSRVVGGNGLAMYSIAYTFFAIFLDITTLGIPQATTKLTSKYINENKSPSGILKGGIFLIFILSIISIIIMNLTCNLFLKISCLNLEYHIGIRLISISLLFTPLVYLFRGFLIGHKILITASISQFLEQLIRTSLILLSCFYIINNNKNYKLAIYVALISVSISSIISLILLLIRINLLKHLKEKMVIKELIKESIPFLVVGVVINLFNLIDSLFFTKGLLKNGFTEAKYIYGIYSFEVLKIINIPISISIGYQTSILPNLVSRKKDTITKALYQMFFIIFPITLFTYSRSDLVYSVLFNSKIGINLLKYYSILIIPLSFMHILNQIMQGINKGKILIVGVLITFILKGLLTYPFILRYNVLGSLYSSLIALIFLILFNIYNLLDELRIEYLDKFLLCIISSIISLIILKYSFLNKYFNLLISSIIYFLIYFFIIYFFNYTQNRNKKHKL